MHITRYPAAFGPYRYQLRVEFTDPHRDSGDGHLVVVMLSPATVKEEEDLIAKPGGTRRRLINFASDEHYHIVTEVNLFAYRSPKRTLLAKAVQQPSFDLVGPENNRVISEAAQEADTLIVGWGAVPRHQLFASRAAEVTGLLEASGKPLYCLGKNNDGSPTSPARIKYAIQPWP